MLALKCIKHICFEICKTKKLNKIITYEDYRGKTTLVQYHNFLRLRPFHVQTNENLGKIHVTS